MQKVVPASKFNVTESMDNFLGKATQSYSVMSWVTYMILIAMILSILITNALVKTNPFWFVAYVFVVILAIVISAVLSNVYEDIATNSVISSGFTGLTTTTWLLLNLPYIVTIVGFIAGILLFINIDWGNPLG